MRRISERLLNVFLSCWLALSVFCPPALASTVIEFYNINLDNYFITADANEAAAIDKRRI